MTYARSTNRPCQPMGDLQESVKWISSYLTLIRWMNYKQMVCEARGPEECSLIWNAVILFSKFMHTCANKYRSGITHAKRGDYYGQHESYRTSRRWEDRGN